MRVLVVSHLFPNSTGPDEGIWLYRLVRGARRLGVDARVINPNRLPGEFRGAHRWLTFARELGGAWTRSPIFEDVPSVHPSHPDATRLPGPWKHHLRRLATRAGFRRLLAQGFEPDLVHAVTSYNSGTSALPLAERRDLPLVVTEISSPYSLEVDPPYRRAGAKAVLDRSAAVACTSAFMARTVRDCFPETARKLEVVYFPAAESFFDRTPRPRRDSTLRLVTACILTEQKGLTFMLEALRLLRTRGVPCHWTLAGDGPIRASLEAQIRALGLEDRVSLLGRVDNARLGDVLSEHDVFVLSSLHETQAVALVEAMAVGLPAVYTRCGGPEEFMSPKVGVPVAPGDAAALADGIEAMASRLDSFDHATIKAECRRQFGEPECAARMVGVYEKAIRGASR